LAVIDAVRASAGAWLLLRGLPGLPPIATLGRWQDAGFLAAAIAIGLLIQTLVWRDEDYVFAPVPYALGLVAAIAHPIVLAIVLPLAVGSAMAVRAWAAGLLGLGFGLAGVGLLCGIAFCFPVLVSTMAGRHFGWPRK
jgi:hypothetical protein